MEDITTAELVLGESKLEVNGRAFVVKALPLRYIISGEFKDSGLIVPRDAGSPGRFMLFNVSEPERAEALDRWMRECLRLDGAPVSLEQAAEYGFTIVDIGLFLDKLVQISG